MRRIAMIRAIAPQPDTPAADRTVDTQTISIEDRLRDIVLVASFVLLILVSATQIKTFPPSAVQYGPQHGDGNALRQGLYSICFLGVLITSRPLVQTIRLVALSPSMLVLLLFCGMSVAWSSAPEVAVRRLILTVIVLWIVFRAVNDLGYRRALSIMTWTLVGVLFVNYAYVALDPSGAIHQGGADADGLFGDWHGLVPHKNDTGPICAITVLLLTFGCGRIKLMMRLALIAASAFFLLKTNSKTSIGLVFLALAVGGAFLRYNPVYRVLILPLLMTVGAALTYASITYVPVALAALDRSEDAFTGRIQIWRTMTAFIEDHVYFGAGFGSFWDAGKVSPANIYGRSWVSEMVTQGHNGYLDLWTQIGLLGLVLAVAILFILPAAKLFITRDIPRNIAALLLGLLVFLAAHNLTETTILTRDYFGNLMLGFVVACIDSVRRTALLQSHIRPARRRLRPFKFDRQTLTTS